MRRKKYVVLLGTLVVFAGAISVPKYIMKKTIDQSFGKAVKAERIVDDGKVAVLNKDEACKLTSLMMQGKLSARKEFIKKVSYNEFNMNFTEFGTIYWASNYYLEFEKRYPMVNHEEQFIIRRVDGEYRSSKKIEMELTDPIISLYQYKENIFYNFETSIWETKWTDKLDILTYSIQSDENFRIYQTEVKVNKPDKGSELKTIHLTEEDVYRYLKMMSMEKTNVKDIKKLSSEQQRFVLETSSDEQYYLDVTSTKTLFRIELKAVAE